MLKKSWIILSLILLLILVACNKEETAVIAQNVTAPVTTNESTNETSSAPSPPPPGTCPGKWICISSTVSAYQDTSCKVINRTTCETECADGICAEQEIEVCNSGFKCKNSNERGFQLESCKWEKKEKCQYGCNFDNNKCFATNQTPIINLTINTTINRTVNTTRPVNTTNTTTTRVVYPTIKLGETAEVNGRNLSIYIIETDRVRLKLNIQKSDWLIDGQNFTFNSTQGITRILVHGILFQGYAGGKKEVIYQVLS